jgi:hypothetical protein
MVREASEVAKVAGASEPQTGNAARWMRQHPDRNEAIPAATPFISNWRRNGDSIKLDMMDSRDQDS